MTKLPVPTAKEINDQHELAKSTATNAVQHAIKCGQMLAVKKKQLGHGGFTDWVETHCKFAYSTAARYMKAAAQISTGVEISTLGQIYPPKPKAVSHSPKGAVPVVKVPDASPKATGETGNDRPAAPIAPQSAPPASPPPTEGEPPRPEWEPDADDVLAETERQIAASTDKVMAADDKLAAAHAEIKRQAAEIAVLKLSRDGAMNARAMAIKQLQAEQRKVARLEKELGKGRKAA